MNFLATYLGSRSGVGEIFLLKYVTECMWSACGLPKAVVSQAHSGRPSFFLAFLHLRQPTSLLYLGKRGFG